MVERPYVLARILLRDLAAVNAHHKSVDDFLVAADLPEHSLWDFRYAAGHGGESNNWHVVYSSGGFPACIWPSDFAQVQLV